MVVSIFCRWSPLRETMIILIFFCNGNLCFSLYRLTPARKSNTNTYNTRSVEIVQEQLCLINVSISDIRFEVTYD